MNENTFIVVDLLTGAAVCELSDKLAQSVNLKKYRLLRPSEYLPVLSNTNERGKS